MASSENLASIDPWAFRSTFADSWMSDAFARDTETITRALQKSLAAPTSEIFLPESISPFLDHVHSEMAPTPTVSGVSGGSDPETASKRQRSTISAPTGRVTKRKSRASKRTQTTFIAADAANFRQMVQQMTGVRFGNLQASAVPILKPEPQRLGRRLNGGGCLPTLDTSAFLLDHHHHETQTMGPGPNRAVSDNSWAGALSFGSVAGISDGGSGGFELDTFSSFPTLESWKVM